MRVLIVDDSVVFRTQISASLKEVPGIEVVGSSANGKIALQKLQQDSVDLITLDMEMPEMNGIETLKHIRSNKMNVKVIMFSSQTIKGAEKALEALREGADDVVAKPSGDQMSFENAATGIRETLVPKILQFIDPTLKKAQSTPAQFTASSIIEGVKSNRITPPKTLLKDTMPKLIVIASSTGGPTALETIFKLLPKKINKPVLITQHMPPVFTEILAKRLSEFSGLDVREAKAGEEIIPGRIYIAPGDYHMQISGTMEKPIISLNQGPQRNSVRPAADFLFETAADVFGKYVDGFVLTGMGEDGALGARRIREKGGSIMIQNKESCIVFGMPGAVYVADDYDEIANLEKIGMTLSQLLS